MPSCSVSLGQALVGFIWNSLRAKSAHNCSMQQDRVELKEWLRRMNSLIIITSLFQSVKYIFYSKKDSFSIPVARHETLLVECLKVHEKKQFFTKTSHTGRSNG